MKTINGISQFECNDLIQVVRGSEWGVMGVVMDVQGGTLSCWGRNPGNMGSSHYRFNIGVGEVMYIGQAKLRPLRSGEVRVSVPDGNLVQSGERKPTMEPAPTRVTPHPAPDPQPPHRTEETPQPVAPSGSAAADAGVEGDPPLKSKPQFGGASVEDAIPHPPKKYEEIKPELLKPATFHRPSSFEAHHVQPPPIPVAQPKEENEHREQPAPNRKATSLPPQGRVQRGGKHQRQSLQVLMEGAEGQPASAGEDEGEAE